MGRNPQFGWVINGTFQSPYRDLEYGVHRVQAVWDMERLSEEPRLGGES